MDVQALDRECALHVTPWDLGNSFVPLYEVAWAGTNSDREGVAVAVELLEPERLLKSLMVQKSQYMNRPPLKIENRQHLLSLTNRSDAAVKVPR